MSLWTRMNTPLLPMNSRSDIYAHAGFYYLFYTLPMLIIIGLLCWWSHRTNGTIYFFVAWAFLVPVIRAGRVAIFLHRKSRQLPLVTGQPAHTTPPL